MLTWQEVVDATQGAAVGRIPDLPFSAVRIDSRAVQPGDLFLCLRGESFDGHDFLSQALAAGARGVVVTSPTLVPDGAWGLTVPDTKLALGQLARAWRRKLSLKVIAVTGSSGKTSTKEMLAAYLGAFGATAKTEGNQNNEIGVPLSLLALEADHAFGVIEMGMRGPGEIAYLTDLAEPDIGIVTNIGTAHIGRLGSREAIASAKSELWRHLPRGARAIVPYDDAMASAEAARWGGAMVSWSLEDPAATVWSHDVQQVKHGQVFTVYWKAGKSFSRGRSEVRLPLWGDHHRANALAAIATGWALGLLPGARLDLKPDTLPGRARQLDLRGILITDDAYNANPESVSASIKAFAQEGSSGRRFVVLGDMAELGEFAEESHRKVGAVAALLPLNGLLAVGQFADAYRQGVGDAFPAHTFDDLEPAARYLADLLAPGDRLLVKASRSARLERLIERLIALLGDPAT
ncbi:MAG: UDP-N-acetylmuramoyl-tripeptide--D-alanyl-D-alanine ligase [Candidatus Sericytochromatia bacterium]|nr:UDP-N-acetylmuramoyl-tripeptide--D-alanyl-D-alanine ligase [Candidatus Sericytochromatia bacterium]